jgi:hypothetical protein
MSAPALRGGLLAHLAAALFGLRTPLVQLFGRGLGAFTTGALFYAGAVGVGLLMGHPPGLDAIALASVVKLLRNELHNVGVI